MAVLLKIIDISLKAGFVPYIYVHDIKKTVTSITPEMKS
jgi:hypothetical protein